MKKELKQMTAPFKSESAAPIVDDRGIDQVISEKAYELHEKGGRRHGCDLEDWLEAEKQVLSERKATKPLTSIPRAK
ncbi:MAG: DUF2934 domain-containing protein [Candidatus Manganitrophaceae bacterium]